MIINYDMQDIIKSVHHLTTFRSGLDLYKQEKVHNFSYYEGLQRAFGKVEDEDYYNVDITFTEFGFEEALCECKDFYDEKGHCKHIVAMLIYAKLSGIEAFETTKLKEVMDYYLDQNYQEPEGSEPVNLVYEMFFHKASGSIGVGLKVGMDIPYVVKDIRAFFENLENNEAIVFGKKFTFDPYFHRFNEKDGKIIDLLKTIAEAVLFHSYDLDNGFGKKYLMLSPGEARRLLKYLEGAFVDLTIKDGKKSYEPSQVLLKQPPVSLKIKENNSNFLIDLSSLKNYEFLNEQGSFLYHEQKIYVLNREIIRDLEPLLKMVEGGYDGLTIYPDELNRFIAYMYPIINRRFSIALHDSFVSKIQWEPCEVRLYLDLEEDRIVARLKYVYGTYIYDAFEGLESKDVDEIIIRDLVKENHVMHLIESSAFKVSKNGYYLEDPEGIYAFLKEGIKALQKQVTIFYSDAFKTLKIITGQKMAFKASFSGSSSFFDFSFDLGPVEPEEIHKLIKSLKEKKKYYRLKDGSFIDLEHSYFDKFKKLMMDLNLDKKVFHDTTLTLPAYFSWYLNEAFEEDGNLFSKDLAFEKLLSDIQSPEHHDYLVPELPTTNIRDYQVKGFNWLKTLSNYYFGGILADDMGLGKTLQTLMYIRSEKKEKDDLKVLIVAPTSLTYNWLNEIHKFFPELKAKVIEGTKKQRLLAIEEGSENLMITSYALVRNDLEMYQSLDIDVCIIDEAQHIKNPDSKTAKAVKALNVNHRYALTGTPIENGLLELWSIFDFIMPNYLGNMKDFKKNYEGENTSKEAHNALKKMIQPFILRRLKKDVLLELPDKIENKIVVDLLEDQKKVYVGYLEKIKEDLEQSSKEGDSRNYQMKLLAALTRLRQIALDPSLFIENYQGKSAKLELLKELIEELMDGGHKVLIFSQFTGVLDRIKNLLKTLNLSYYTIDGSTPSIKRNEQVNAFNTDETPLFLISLKAGGTGLNLTGADTVIHFDPWWNPAVEDQATDRAHRIGQKKTVHVIKLIAQGTIEEKIFELQEKKKALIEQVIQPGETWITKLSEEEIKNLLK
jgi:superfamily II DNA or RNA helicase